MILILLVVILAAMACLVGGVFLLAGAGWALIASSACLVLVAIMLLRGLRSVSA